MSRVGRESRLTEDLSASSPGPYASSDLDTLSLLIPYNYRKRSTECTAHTVTHRVMRARTHAHTVRQARTHGRARAFKVRLERVRCRALAAEENYLPNFATFFNSS